MNLTTNAPEPQDWWSVSPADRYDNIARLAAYLAITTNDADVVADMVNKPWHYTAQYEAMEAAQASADNALKIEAEA